jgi:hypothetical protein
MRYLVALLLIAVPLTASAAPKRATHIPARVTKQVAYLTAYAAGDNTPPNTNLTWISGRGGNAGGIGTYKNPITVAVGYVGHRPDLPAGTKFYIPNLRRYFVVGDICGGCHGASSSGQLHVDLYAGNYWGSGVLSCESAVSGRHTIIKNPARNYRVVAGSLYNGRRCTRQYGDTV